MNEKKKVRSIKDLIEEQKERQKKRLQEKSPGEMAWDLHKSTSNAMTLSVISLLITIILFIFVLWMYFKLEPLFELLP